MMEEELIGTFIGCSIESTPGFLVHYVVSPRGKQSVFGGNSVRANSSTVTGSGGVVRRQYLTAAALSADD